MEVLRIAAFSDGAVGGNPAGVVLCETMPAPELMQSIAADVGYSETAFAAPDVKGWRVRYFAPEIEVPFCGHATIALGAALAMAHGDGVFPLSLNDAEITVEGRRDGERLSAALQSPPTRSRAAPPALVSEALKLFSYDGGDLDPRVPPAVIEAGASHLVLALADRRTLAAMHYDLAVGRSLMLAEGLTTISLVHSETPTLWHARNPFAAGGVYEDPATGAAAAALGGYLRDLDWPHGGDIQIIQGADMGAPSRLYVTLTPEPGGSVRVTGAARLM